MSDEATFSIKIDADPNTPLATANALEELRVKGLASEQAIKNLSAATRALRGTSDEVKGAKEKLKAQLDAEKSALSATNLELLKQGTTLGALKNATTNAKKEHDGLNQGLLKLLGVSREARVKIHELESSFTAAQLAQAGLVAGSLALVAALAAAVAGVVAITAAVGKWIAVGTDANRVLALNRQFIAGSAEDSARMGDQIDRLRQKIPLTTDELSKLYVTTRQGFDGARISGQGILDVVEAVAAASGAGADSAAKKIDEIIARGKESGRIGINLGRGQGAKGELAGTGISGLDIAEGLAARTKISVEAARLQLIQGRAPIEAAAGALKDAANKAFADINLQKMTTLDALTKKWHDDWTALTKGVDLSGLWKALGRIENLFSTTTSSGYALKKIVETIGSAFGVVGNQSAPLFEQAIKRLILEAARLRVRFLEWRLSTNDLFSKDVREGAKELILDVETLIVMFGQAAKAAGYVGEALKGLFGSSGYEEGLKALQGGGASSPTREPTAVTRTRQPAGFEREGTGTRVAPAHAEGGVVMRPAPGEAFASVAPGEVIVPAAAARAGGASARGGAGGGLVVQVGGITVHVDAGGAKGGAKAGAELGAQIKASLLPEITKLFEDAMKTAGVPTQTVPVPG